MKPAPLFAIALAVCAASPGQTKPSSTELQRKVKVLELAAVAGPEQCDAIAGYLTDPSYDIRLDAASSLYWKCNRARIGAKFGAALSRSVQLGNGNAGAYLLLGYAPAKTAAPCLHKAARRRDEMVKLVTSSKPVSISLVVDVALARLGDEASLHALRKHFEKPALDDAMFLLAALSDVEDHPCLRKAVGLLGDTREAPGVLAHSSRTVRDVALEALAARLKIKPSFAIEPGTRYSDEQIHEFRKAAELALAK